MNMTQQDRIRRADEFKRVWDEYNFDQAVEAYRKRLHDDFEASEGHETKKREDIHRQLQLTRVIKQHIISILTDGDAAKIELKGKHRAR